MKKCKYCKNDIPKKAKVCPDCNKKVKGKGCLITFLVFFILFGGILISVISKHDFSKSNKVVEEQKNNFKLDKQELEEYLTDILELKNPKFSFKSYRDWEAAGFIMVENTFEVDGIEHTYVAMIGKDGIIYKLTIDGELVIKSDADTLAEYMSKYPSE